MSICLWVIFLDCSVFRLYLVGSCFSCDLYSLWKFRLSLTNLYILGSPKALPSGGAAPSEVWLGFTTNWVVKGQRKFFIYNIFLPVLIVSIRVPTQYIHLTSPKMNQKKILSARIQIFAEKEMSGTWCKKEWGTWEVARPKISFKRYYLDPWYLFVLLKSKYNSSAAQQVTRVLR